MDEAARPAVSAQRTLRNVAAITVVLAGLKLGAGLLVPIACAIFLALLSRPLLRRLLARRVPVGLAVLVTFLVLLAAVGLFAVLLLVSLSELRDVAPTYARMLQERIAYTDEWWQGRGISLREWVPERWREPQRVVELLGGAIRGTAILLSEILVVLLLLPSGLAGLTFALRDLWLRSVANRRGLHVPSLVADGMVDADVLDQPGAESPEPEEPATTSAGGTPT